MRAWLYNGCLWVGVWVFTDVGMWTLLPLLFNFFGVLGYLMWSSKRLPTYEHDGAAVIRMIKKGQDGKV